MPPSSSFNDATGTTASARPPSPAPRIEPKLIAKVIRWVPRPCGNAPIRQYRQSPTPIRQSETRMLPYQTPITIKVALDRIHKHEYVLPAIQREFLAGRP
jgi:hypothetical protein